MHVGVMDGNAVFAKYIIHIKGKELPCFTEKELNSKLRHFESLNEDYSVEEIIWDKQKINKGKGVKFQSRDEAINYLINDIMPESKKMEILKEENETLKKSISEQQDIIDFFIQPQKYSVE